MKRNKKRGEFIITSINNDGNIQTTNITIAPGDSLDLTYSFDVEFEGTRVHVVKKIHLKRVT